MSNVTTKSITDSQIRALRTEAMNADDLAQVILCDIALGYATGIDEYSGAGFSGYAAQQAKDAVGTSQDDAIAACVEAVNYARAMVG